MKNYRPVSVSIARDSAGRFHLRVSGLRGEVIADSLAEVMAAAYRCSRA